LPTLRFGKMIEIFGHTKLCFGELDAVRTHITGQNVECSLRFLWLPPRETQDRRLFGSPGLDTFL
jgi:hypothetical protein